jgi:hypothetical protein
MAVLFRKDGWVKSTLGPAIAGAQVYVCSQPADTAFVPPLPQIPLFSDPNGVAPLAQPVITDGFGHYNYYAEAGFYTEAIVNGGKVQQVYLDQMVGTPSVAVNNPTTAIPGLSGAVQTTRVSYGITAVDLVNGYAVIPVIWDSPWPDVKYTTSVSGVSSLLSPVEDFAIGAIHNITGAGLNAVIQLTAAIPLVQGQEDLVASLTATNVIALVAPITTMYQVTMYYGPSRTSALDAGKTWTPTVSWTDPSGNALQASSTSPTIVLGPASGGNTGSYGVNYLQDFNIPFYVLAGSTISVTGAYVGGTFPVNVSVRIVQMPNNSVVYHVGDVFTVEAVSIHD